MMRSLMLKSIALALAVVVMAMPTVGMAQQSFYYWWQVVDERGEPYTGQNVSCSVYRPQTHAAVILHTSANLTSGGNSPLFSDGNGKLHFYSSSSDPVNVNCYYAGGGGAQVSRFRTTDHKIVIPRQGGLVIARFPVNAAAATYQSDSGIVIPGGSVIRDVIIQNLNPLGLGTYHLNVGFLGNHTVATSEALARNVPLTASGVEWIRPQMTIVTAGSPAASHRGTALEFHVASLASVPGIYVERPYVVHVATGLAVSYSAQPGTGGALRAHVFILYNRLHSMADRFGLTN